MAQPVNDTIDAILRVLLVDVSKEVDIAGGCIVCAMIVMCIGFSARGLIKLNESYEKGDALKASCVGHDYLIAETGQEMAAQENKEVSKDIYMIIAIFIAAFTLTYWEFNRWFIALNADAFITLADPFVGSIKWLLYASAIAVSCGALPILLYVLMIRSNAQAMNAAHASNSSYSGPDPIPIKFKYGSVPIFIVLLAILQIMFGKSDMKLKCLLGVIVTLLVFQYAYFPNMSNIQTAILNYNKNAQILDATINSNPVIVDYCATNYYKINNELNAHPDNIHQYVLANSKVTTQTVAEQTASNMQSVFDPRAMKFGDPASVDAYNFMTPDTIGPLVKSAHHQMKMFLMFAAIVCIFPLFHWVYRFNPQKASLIVLGLTCLVGVAAFATRIYLELDDLAPPPLAAQGSNVPVVHHDGDGYTSVTTTSPLAPAGTFWSDITAGIQAVFVQQTSNQGIISAPALGMDGTKYAAVNNIRHTWAVMKADTSIKKAVDSLNFVMRILVIVPIIMIVGTGFHIGYTTSQYMTISAVVAIIVASLLMSSSYAAFSGGII